MPYDRILDLMSPAGAPDIYLLGNYAKRLTLYSQQTRAINLVEAVHWYRKPWKDVKLAVVGGGVSGLTAAAQAFRRGARVTLIERLQNLLELQNKSDRWLHPTLYEWPLSGLDPAEGRTDLPVMNWNAGIASEVARTLRQEWTDQFANDVPTLFNSEVLRLTRSPEGCILRWCRKTRSDEEQEDACFDAVIFAVGFGLERKGPNRRSYWENDALDKTLRSDECVLIAGYGDGALTDLMRACLNQFDRRELLTSVVLGAEGAATEQIKRIESDYNASDPSYITAAYKQLDAPGVRAILQPNLNATRKVVLAGEGPDLFDPRASALNRLVASQLLRLQAFEHIPAGGRFDAVDASDPVFMEVQQRAGRPFTDIVLRVGVDRTITRIEGLPPSVAALQREWNRIPVRSDPTRVRLWARFRPIAKDIDHSCVLFLASESDEDFLKEIAQRAIEDVELPERLHLNVVPLTECFRSDEALLHSVRALCRAPVVIFALGGNMGRNNLTGMLLMGIRAAVRRGATLIVHEGVLAPADWGRLPFNLKELQIYPLDAESWVPSAARITGAIRAGLAVLRSDSQGYRDMPVFDIVRRPTRRTEAPPTGEREVFVLCSYGDSYEESWQRLQLWLNGKSDGMGGKLSLKRVIDYG